MSLIFCTNCGKPITTLNEHNECEYCGTRLPDYVVKDFTNRGKANTPESDNPFNSVYNNRLDNPNLSTNSTLGEKIKIFALLILIIDIIGSFILASNTPLSYRDEFNTTVLFAGLISSSVLFVFLYGLGEIVHRVISIDTKLNHYKK